MTVPVLSLVPLAVAGVLLAIWRPTVALLLPLVAHAGYLVRSSVPLGAFTLPITVLELVIGIAVITGISRWEATKAALRAVPKPAVALVLLFVLASTVSAAIAPHPRTSWGIWKAFIVEPILYAAALTPLLRTQGGRRSVAGALLLGGVISAVSSLVVGAATPDFGRLRGIYDVPNSLALVLAPLAVGSAVLAQTEERSSLRRFARFSLVLFVPTLLLTQSLGGILSVALAGIFMFWGSRRHNRRATDTSENSHRSRTRGRTALSVLTLVVAAGLGLQLLTGKFSYAVRHDSSLTSRLSIWGTSLQLIQDQPFRGTGLGTFEPAYQQKLHEILKRSPELPVQEWVVRDPHNVILSFWLHTGLLGLLSMGILVARALKPVFRPPNVQSATLETLIPRVGAAALLTLVLFGVSDVPYLKNDLSLLWWAYLVVALSSPTRTGDRA